MAKYKKNKRARRDWWKNLSGEERAAYIAGVQERKANRRRYKPVVSKDYPMVTPKTRGAWLKRIMSKNPWLKKRANVFRVNMKPKKRKAAADWLRKFLLDKGEFAVPARVCLAEAHKQGIKPRTLQRAKYYLSIYCFRSNHQWYWYLEEAYR